MQNKSLSKTIFSVTIITFLSRLLSLLSTQLYFSTYGSDNPYINIYSHSIKVPTVIFTCIGTLLTTVVVPIYSTFISKNEKKKADKFLNDIISISSLCILVLIAICFISAPLFFGTKFKDDTEMFQFAIQSLRVLLPVMFFNGLNFIFQGILQSHGKFKLTAAVNIPSSLSIIIYVAFFGHFGVKGLVYATLLGLSMQAIFLLPAVIKTGYIYKPSFDYKSPEIIHCAKQTIPVLIAASAYQINTIVSSYLAMSLGENGKNAILDYVQNLVLVSILGFVYSITSVYYPKLSVLWGTENKNEYKQTLAQVLNVVLFFLVPATFGFILVRYSVFDLLARWGKFTSNDAFVAGNILGLYSFGIIALGFKEILDRAFYAQKNTKISAITGFVIMGTNIALSLLLIKNLDIYALPIAYSISSTIGICLLLFVMRIKIGKFAGGVLKTGGKALISALVMSVIIYFENIFIKGYLGDSLIDRIIILFVPSVTGAVVYFVMAYILKMEQVYNVINKIRK